MISRQNFERGVTEHLSKFVNTIQVIKDSVTTVIRFDFGMLLFDFLSDGSVILSEAVFSEFTIMGELYSSDNEGLESLKDLINLYLD